MSAIQNIFRSFGQEYLDRYGDNMPSSHRKVIRAISNCYSGHYGTVLFSCHKCGSTHFINCSCGNRHCPNCQNEKAVNWLQSQMNKLLPTHYFLLTFTLPEALRFVVRSNQRLAYKAMFFCAHESLKKLALDKRFVGSSRIGHLAVLHTWGGMLQFHPHLHLIIPGGALSEDGLAWLSSRNDLFVHSKPLAVIFKAMFRDQMKKAGLFNLIDPGVWQQQWVVDSQAAGQGHNCLRYLSRYVFRVAISNNRITKVVGRSISFKYKDRVNNKWKSVSLDAMEFIRRFLQHVLPSGFMKIRYYGFLNSNCSVTIDKISEFISLLYDVIRIILPENFLMKKLRELKCARCGCPMHPISFVPAVSGSPPL